MGLITGSTTKKPTSKSAMQESRLMAALPDQAKDGVHRIILAGRKIMYAPETKEIIENELSQNIPDWQKLGESIAGLMVIIDGQAQGKIPSAFIVPSAIQLTFDAADFLQESGRMDLNDEDVAQATIYVSILLLKKMRVPDEQIMQMAQQLAKQSGTTVQNDVVQEAEKDAQGG